MLDFEYLLLLDFERAMVSFVTLGWDPVYILAQIVAVQCLYYLSLGTILFVLVGPFVPAVTTSFIFDWRAVKYVGEKCIGRCTNWSARERISLSPFYPLS